MPNVAVARNDLTRRRRDDRPHDEPLEAREQWNVLDHHDIDTVEHRRLPAQQSRRCQEPSRVRRAVAPTPSVEAGPRVREHTCAVAIRALGNHARESLWRRAVPLEQVDR
jgi:hypothetical protein